MNRASSVHHICNCCPEARIFIALLNLCCRHGLSWSSHSPLEECGTSAYLYWSPISRHIPGDPHQRPHKRSNTRTCTLPHRHHLSFNSRGGFGTACPGRCQCHDNSKACPGDASCIAQVNCAKLCGGGSSLPKGHDHQAALGRKECQPQHHLWWDFDHKPWSILAREMHQI